MIKNLEITHFKGIKNLKLDNLSRINIFVGKPNTCKSTILEAICLYFAQNQFDLRDILDVRAMSFESDCFLSLFHNYNASKNIVINADNNALSITIDNNYIMIAGNKTYPSDDESLPNRITLDYHNREMTFTRNIAKYDQVQFEFLMGNKGSSIDYKSSCVQLISQNNVLDKTLKNLTQILESKKKFNELKEVCKKFSLNIESLELVKNKIIIRKKHIDKAINFKLSGHGFQKYIAIQSCILSGKKYICIDEIENGLHFESIKMVLQNLIDCDKNIQFFITTHNEEILNNLTKINLNKNEVSLFNIFENKNGDIESVRFSQDELLQNLSVENELRG
ncbi:AAA family ATPase [Helicobacter saguini]|uniref:ATPase n=1 Tax=Helicobacter saguini TaxID=1548018 RepID=A0A347VR87_9HELI|nr:AAA family ATPase [Helicobacter saguini]MWV62993.1 AAA family ATPase [Helicobacter saguini]MWV66338.1 AAA family ATPase [Helicobacter saguini]MWV68690.1 AAA family ATPase [Helicobacter saguini]MWV71759.1 AAA family ATPase [Helicobacter saguini]TLD91546.1 ATPase [Helicobacter saguini]